MRAHRVDPQLVPEIWPKVSDWIAKALDKGDRWWTLDSLRHLVETNPDSGLFVMIDRRGMYGVFIVTVEETPRGERVAQVNVCAGSRMSEWIDRIEALEDWARSKGAATVAITGRTGWARVLAGKGYEKAPAVLLEKTL